MILATIGHSDENAVMIGRFLFNEGLADIATPDGHEPKVNGEKAANFIHFCLEHGIVWGLFDDGELRGVLSAITERPWWGDNAYLRDGFFVIARQARSIENFRALMIALETHAAHVGIPAFITISDATEFEKKEKLLSLAKYRRVMGFYRKEAA